MMDSLATVVLDLSDRPYLKMNYDKRSKSVKEKRFKGEFDFGLMEEFMKAPLEFGWNGPAHLLALRL